MAGSLPTSYEECLEELRRTVERTWGASRLEADGRNIERTAHAWATVAAFPLPAEIEPLPTWPEVRHG